MFAVSGWSVNSELVTSQGVASAEATEGSTFMKSSKKRKRDRKLKRAEVNSQNLSDLWEAVIEGRGDISKLNREQKLPRREKTVGDARGCKPGSITRTDVRSSKDRSAPKARAEKARRQPKAFTQIREPTESLESKDIKIVQTEGDHKQRSVKNGSEWKRVQKKHAGECTELAESVQQVYAGPRAHVKQSPGPRLTPLQDSMRQKLISARFRHINQVLYTTPSSKALEMFQISPDMFQVYHEGFRKQVGVWPENPVDGYISQIRQRGQVRNNSNKQSILTPLPRTGGACHIADLGCGDASLARNLQEDLKRLQLKIKSFDLQSPHHLVTAADISKLPLQDDSVDLAIFCLALMGTNWVDFIEEAFRVLRWRGELWVAEAKSRFARPPKNVKESLVHGADDRIKRNSQGAQESEGQIVEKNLMAEIDGVEMKGADVDVRPFLEVLSRRGFTLAAEVKSANKMFIKMVFVKSTKPMKGNGVKKVTQRNESIKIFRSKFIDEEPNDGIDETSVLKPCMYKLR